MNFTNFLEIKKKKNNVIWFKQIVKNKIKKVSPEQPRKMNLFICCNINNTWTQKKQTFPKLWN